MTKQGKRERLLSSATDLFYKKGPLNSSLADVANNANVPIGNVYYYFKTKEDLILAVIDRRKKMFRSAYETLNGNVADPRLRLLEMVRFFESVAEDYTQYGCPLGRMAMELNAESIASQKQAAAVLDDFILWASEQFDALGHCKEALKLATTFMSGVQGAAIMANAQRNKNIFMDEMQRLREWIEYIPNLRVPIGKGLAV